MKFAACLPRWQGCRNAVRKIACVSRTDLARYNSAMRVDGKSMRTIWLEPDGWSVGVIDQTALPHRLATARLTTLSEAAHAIRAMVVRGAPLIGAAAAYGMALALREDASDEAVE